MTDLISYVIRGIPIGCVFALMAIGIVLTYKTAGVFNLAFGAQAFVSAAVFYDMVARRHWSVWVGFFVSVVIVGPLIGFILDRALYRHIRTAPPLAKLVTSLGLLVAIPQLVKLWFGQGAAYNPPGLIPSDHVFRLGQFSLDTNQVTTIAATIIVVVGLTIMFKVTNLGLQMRAVVESPRMTELNGINAARIGTFSWMLSSFFAGLAGVLLAPLFALVSDINFFTLLVAALAAAAFGRLTSIPLTLVGALGLGILQQLLAGYLPPNSVLATGLRPSLPFLALFLLLLFWPGLRKPREIDDPLAGVDPPPPQPAAALRSRGLTIGTRIFGTTLVAGALVISLGVLNQFWLGIVTRGVILALIFLSFTVLTGLGGQISLCQATFAAVGAFATAQIVEASGMSVIVAMLLGAAVAAVVGAIIALPAIRLGGIYLALATLAFALMFEYVLKPLNWVSGGIRPPKVPRPIVGAIDFADNRSFFLLAVGLLAITAVLVWLVKRGNTGRFLDAMRGSELGAASIGIDPFRAKVIAFALSAAIAGFGGGLLASFEQRVNYDANFSYYIGLVWIVLVISLGARSIQAAINAGISFFLVPRLLELIGFSQTFSQSVAFILFGLGAITYAKHPEGIIEAQTRSAVQRTMRILGKRAANDDKAPPEHDDGLDTSVGPIKPESVGVTT